MRVTDRAVTSALGAAAVAGAMAIAGAQHARADTPMTAGVVLEKMPSNELVVFVAGIVEGLAYARFRQDTKVAGKNDERGMNCIRNWYHGSDQIILKIQSTFKKYDKYPPWVVVAAMVKKECGE